MSSPLPLTPEQRAKKYGTIAKVIAVLGVGFVVAPYVFTAITGLVGLVVAGLIVLGTWAVLPALGDFASNLRLKMIKAEAARNPIETLENEYRRRIHLLEERKIKIETLAAKTAGFGSKLTQFKREYPDEAQTYTDIYNKMLLLLKRSREQWTVASNQLDAFDSEITKAKAKWDMALAANALRQDAGNVEAEFLAKLKVECSFDTIETGMNMAFAQLDTLIMESESVEINVTNSAPKQALPSSQPVNTISVDTKAKDRVV